MKINRKNVRKTRHTLAMLLVGMAGIGQHATAAAYCVNSQQSLQVALVLAQISQQGFTFQFAKGVYASPGGDNFFSAPTTMLGGYNADCSARAAVINAADTVLDFSGGATAFYQNSASPNAQITVDGMTLQNADHVYFQAGQYNNTGANDSGNIKITRTRIGGVSNAIYGSQLVTFGGGSIELENVQFDHLPGQTPNDNCALTLDPYDSGYISIKHVTADLPPNRALCLGLGGDPDGTVVDIYNSILWSSTGQPTTIENNSSVSKINIYNSVYFALTANGAATSIAAPVHTDPQWVNAPFYDYHLASTSPAVNSGTPIPPGGLPNTDIEGNARWIGAAPDRGAYESAFNASPVITVSNTSDSATLGSGSLRDAINQANSLPNAAKINFAIPGNCPQVITLASALPTVTSPITIDGGTQPGSSSNTDADAFNANICVVIKPASGTIGNGFVVPSGANQGSLTLRGVGMGGFGQPVLLLGGSNHVIAGNQLGGSVGGIALAGAGLYGVSIGVNASGSLIVGGQSLADRNVIGGAGFAGVNIQSTVLSSTDKCQIVNNLIGLAPNGINALPNFNGVTASGSGCSINANRIAGNSQDGILVNGGNNNVIQRNIIGVAINGNGFFNSGVGVHISSGSGNVIGSSGTSAVSGTFLSNTIRYMVDGGVLVAAGTNNSVRSNLIYDNGASGAGFDIDLGTVGATANDSDDVDSGANNLQNYPLIGKIFFSNTPPVGATDFPGSVTATLNSTPGSYRIDAYFSNRCDNGAFHVTGRGHANAYAGTTAVTIPAGGTTVAFSMPVKFANVQSDGIVSLTATDTLGNTSEIGSCGFLSNALSDVIFRDTFGS